MVTQTLRHILVSLYNLNFKNDYYKFKPYKAKERGAKPFKCPYILLSLTINDTLNSWKGLLIRNATQFEYCFFYVINLICDYCYILYRFKTAK